VSLDAAEAGVPSNKEAPRRRKPAASILFCCAGFITFQKFCFTQLIVSSEGPLFGFAILFYPLLIYEWMVYHSYYVSRWFTAFLSGWCTTLLYALSAIAELLIAVLYDL
jgi:hypothetical protein